MVRYTLKQCEYFLAVARSGGIAQAARHLNISQPAIAQAIDKLENLTGLTLFERRHARGLSLTVQGRTFQRQAEKLIVMARDVAAHVDHIAAGNAGTIRLGCFQSIAPFHGARLVQHYQEDRPGVTLEITELLQGDLVTHLVAGDLDVAILYDLSLDPAMLEWTILSEPKPYILLAADHPLAKYSSLSLRALKEEPYILFDAPDSRDYFYGIFSDLQITPKISFRSTSFESVRSAVGRGLGFSLLTMRHPGAMTYDGGRVSAIEIQEDIPPTKIVMARKAGTKAGPLVEDFIDFCLADFKGRASYKD